MNSHAVIKDALAPLGVTVVRDSPPPQHDRNDFIVVTLTDAGQSIPGLVERPGVLLEAWVGTGDEATRKSRCHALALAARDALWDAWKTGRRSADGAINFVVQMPTPQLMPSGIDGVYRATWRQDVTIRP